MKDARPEASASRLLELSNEVSGIAGSLTRVSIALRASVETACARSTSSKADAPLKQVLDLIHGRQKRKDYLPAELLGEPAWDILLNLLRAELAYERISISGALQDARLSPTAGLRWLTALERRRLVIVQGDVRNAHDAFVLLSRDASKALRRYLVELAGSVTACEPNER